MSIKLSCNLIVEKNKDAIENQNEGSVVVSLKPFHTMETSDVRMLKEYVGNTEDFLNIQLDTDRNQLIKYELLLTTATFFIGVFGMNFSISLFDNDVAFKSMWVKVELYELLPDEEVSRLISLVNNLRAIGKHGQLPDTSFFFIQWILSLQP